MIAAVASLFGASARRVAFDQKDLGFFRVALLTIGELAGQVGNIERALASRQLACLARRLPCARRLEDLVENDLPLARMLFEPSFQRATYEALDGGARLRRDELVLRLTGELRIRHAQGENGGQPFACILACRRQVLAFRRRQGRKESLHLARERRAKAHQVCAAVALRDRVRETQHRLVIALVPLQRAGDLQLADVAIDFAAHRNRERQRRARSVEPS